MDSEMLFELVSALFKILGIIVAVYIAPSLKNALGGIFDYVSNNKFLKFVLQMVEWANQTIPAEEWERKKQEVYERVLAYVQQNTSIGFTEEQIDAIIEAFVIECKKDTKKTTKK